MGSTPVSRVGASLLVQLGLQDWIAKTPIEFIEIAMRGSGDLELLAALRSGMRDRFARSTLGSPRRFTEEFETEMLNKLQSRSSPDCILDAGG
jgi:predicted O-linked N-acetylglucosamine transferase (SPINDLY family)